MKKRSISPISSPDNDEKPITAPRQNCISPSLIRKSKRQRIEAPKVTEETSDNKVYLNKAGILLLFYVFIFISFYEIRLIKLLTWSGSGGWVLRNML